MQANNKFDKDNHLSERVNHHSVEQEKQRQEKLRAQVALIFTIVITLFGLTYLT